MRPSPCRRSSQSRALPLFSAVSARLSSRFHARPMCIIRLWFRHSGSARNGACGADRYWSWFFSFEILVCRFSAAPFAASCLTGMLRRLFETDPTYFPGPKLSQKSLGGTMQINRSTGGEAAEAATNLFEKSGGAVRHIGEPVTAHKEFPVTPHHEIGCKEPHFGVVEGAGPDGAAARQPIGRDLVAHVGPEQSRRVGEDNAAAQVNLLRAGRDGGLVSDLGLALSHQGVDQGRLADVRNADDHDPQRSPGLAAVGRQALAELD